MISAEVAQVRRFNRLVTQSVGALQSSYLARDRSLGESRVLWEIGIEGRDVRDLRASLDLDSGYLSRILRSLEDAGLVVVRQNIHDRRVRVAHLTPQGSVERVVLDERSDELALSVLEPLTRKQRAALTAAMSTVEHLFTAAMIRVDVSDPADPPGRYCLNEYAQELDRRFRGGFDAGRSISARPDELREPHGILLIAMLHDQPVGCGALKFHDAAPTEIKRMWVAEQVRGLGLGRRLLSELERYATGHGSRVLRLETNRALQEAITLYRSAGYVEVPPFNAEPYAHHWFEKAVR